jgi:hypothetical protein
MTASPIENEQCSALPAFGRGKRELVIHTLRENLPFCSAYKPNQVVRRVLVYIRDRLKASHDSRSRLALGNGSLCLGTLIALTPSATLG